MLNSIVLYKNKYFYIDKLYKSYNKYDGMISITCLDNEEYRIRISVSSVLFISSN